jgi:hypothetical protein
MSERYALTCVLDIVVDGQKFALQTASSGASGLGDLQARRSLQKASFPLDEMKLRSLRKTATRRLCMPHLVLTPIKAHSLQATAPDEAPIPTRLVRAWPRHFPT